MKLFKSKKWLLIGAMALSTALVACGDDQADGTEAAESTTLKLAHVAPSTGPIGEPALAFKAEVEDTTGGSLKMEVYEGGQLGGLRELTEQLEMGSLEMGVISVANLSSYVKELNVLDMPYLFKDREHVYKNLDGEFGNYLKQKLEDEAGIKVLGFWEYGFGTFGLSKEIKKPEDLKGLSLRLQPSDILINTFTSLGVESAAVDSLELNTSIQQGIIDGSMYYYNACTDTKCYEVVDYFVETYQSFGVITLAINKAKFDSLTEDQQKTLVELGEKYTQEQRKMNTEKEESSKEAIEEYGVKIVTNDEIDVEAFRAATKDVYDQYAAQYKDVLDLVVD